MSKQYLMICDEVGLDILGKLFKPESVQFLEVKGMALNNPGGHCMLVTPVIQPLNQSVSPEITDSEPATTEVHV